MSRLFASWAFIVALSSAALASNSAAQGTFQRTFQVSGPVDLEVLTQSGDVTVRSGAGGTVSITGKIHVGNRWLTGDRESDVHEIEKNPPLRQSGNNIRIDYTNYRNISIDYEITAPAETSVRTRAGSGDVTIEELRGNIDLQSGSGDFRLRDLKGELRIETGSGDVRAEGISGPVDAHAGSGDITLEETGTGDVTARTGSGNIHVRGVKGALRAESGSGDQKVEGTPTGSWSVRTGSGNSELRLADVGLDLDLTTNSGTITVDKPLVTTVQGRVQEERHHITGKINGGGPLVTVRTGSGNVHIY